MSNIVHLEFKGPHTVDDAMCFIACAECRNKTYTLVEDKLDNFPLMRCSACGQHMGRMGWVHDDDPLVRGPSRPKPPPPGRWAKARHLSP